MDRLTERNKDGSINFCGKYGDTPYPVVTQETIEKLADYKDPEFTPEEIACMAQFLKEQTSEEVIADNMKTVARLLEWSKWKDAEEEGRLVVLPYKVGDTVYEIHNNTDACHECRNFSSFYGMDSMCDVIEDEDKFYPEVAESPVCEKQFFQIILEYTPSVDWVFNHRKEFGKTVFLTREEAEAALEKMKGETK